LEVAQHGRPFPPRQVRSHPQCQPTRLHDAGTTHDGLAERPAADRDAGVTQEVVGELPELTHPGHGTRVAGGPARAGPDGAREVGDGAADELPADVEPEHETRTAALSAPRIAQREDRRPAAKEGYDMRRGLLVVLLAGAVAAAWTAVGSGAGAKTSAAAHKAAGGTSVTISNEQGATWTCGFNPF